ncbi:peptidylprolyl isomerase [Altericista sp. CCNU0014]|uniref:peptidylprolyl isomerase n=1 Tax=Altericista sp. CCNU0014 TaxID=3082949 RepID=UPI00384DEB2D
MRRMLRPTIEFLCRPLMAIALVALLASCGTPTESTSSAADTAATITTASVAPVLGSASPIAASTASLPKLNGKATVVLTVKGKPITIEVNGTDAPITAGNFVDLAKRGFYDGTAFHRVVPGFVAQGGDPYSKLENPPGPVGTGGFVDPKTKRPRDIPLEIWAQGASAPTYSKTLKSAGVTQPPKLRHARGAVAMARSAAEDSASSQFYIALDNGGTANLDGDYAVFGIVKSGMETVDQIEQGDRIETAKVTQGLANLKP